MSNIAMFRLWFYDSEAEDEDLTKANQWGNLCSTAHFMEL